jgi:hypothetical protein
MHKLFSIQFQSLQSIQNKDAFLKRKKIERADSSCPGRCGASWAGPTAAFPRWLPAESVRARPI